MLYVISIVLAADMIANRSNIMEHIKYWLFYRIYTKSTRYKPYRIKPFDCTMCLSFWLCLILTRDIILSLAAGTCGAILSTRL